MSVLAMTMTSLVVSCLSHRNQYLYFCLGSNHWTLWWQLFLTQPLFELQVNKMTLTSAFKSVTNVKIMYINYWAKNRSERLMNDFGCFEIIYLLVLDSDAVSVKGSSWELQTLRYIKSPNKRRKSLKKRETHQLRTPAVQSVFDFHEEVNYA